MDLVIRLAAQYWHLVVVGTLLALLSLGFVFKFCRQALRLGNELDGSIRGLKDIRSAVKGPIVDLEGIAAKAMKSPALAHLWSEYAKTLHSQSKEGADGQVRIVKWRSTTLAETFFSEQAVVDTRLKTEFYKHLPGILTGLGIIGTFTGLIFGLIEFNVSLEPKEAQAQLRSLVNSVGHAFIISGTAICLAMLFTWIEKSLVASRYRQVEELRGLIDSTFEVGAGEEYLERLVFASENASTQSAHIKDLLVADIEKIMSKLTEQQIVAQAQQTNQMSVDVGKAIADSLGPPMQAISEAVKGVGQNQGEAVNKMLTDVLASFSAQMRDMFGGQMQGMSDLLRKTSESMQATAVQFGQLAANMDAAGTGAVEAMGERLNSALEAMEARQQVMNTHMSSFVESIRSIVSESQSESARKLQETLGAVGDQVAGVIAELRRQAEASADSQGARQERFEQSTGAAIGSLSEHMEKLLGQSVETNKSLQDTVAKLASATDKAITGMNSGAETLYVAASDFAKAGQGVADTMRASTVAVEA
ncbi:MAG: anti-phage ZorAB system protein ZorA, partial [Betaproteobacteria bacterium]